MSRLRLLRREQGYTIVEVMAALVVFALVTVAVVPLLSTSIRSSLLGNTYAVGKNLTVQAMERIRGLPYFISYTAQSGKVDVLDLYFPDKTSATAEQRYTASDPAYTFTTTCTSEASANPACPKNLPAGYTVIVSAQFVTPVDSGTETTSYTPAEPAAGYRWDPPPTAPTADQPPSQLLMMTVSTRWQVAERDKSFSTTSLLTDRPVGETAVSGEAEITYGVQLLTTYKDLGGALSDLTATAGVSQSQISTRQVSTASQIVDAGSIRLAPAPTDPSYTPVEGARVAYQAPPTQSPVAATVTCPNGSPDLCELRHQGLGGTTVAGLNGTTVDGVQVSVATELPKASGRFTYAPSSELEDLWVNPQGPFDAVKLFLQPSGHMFSLRPRGDDDTLEGLTGTTSAATTALSAADSSVTTAASVSLRDLRLLPTTFIGPAPRTVVWIEQFTASTTCKATGTATAPDPTATWTATLRYWRDSNPADNLPAGAYSAPISLSGTLASDPLAALTGANNPLVYDGLLPASDVYLFKTGTQNGYLTGWSSLYDVSTTGVTKDAEGTSRTATIAGAIRIDTAPLHADPLTYPASGLRISIGSLSCRAVDKR